MGEKTVPILPCRTIPPVVDSYRALGFETTYLQNSPNPYAVVERGDIELHFFGLKQYEPAESYSTAPGGCGPFGPARPRLPQVRLDAVCHMVYEYSPVLLMPKVPNRPSLVCTQYGLRMFSLPKSVVHASGRTVTQSDRDGLPSPE